MSLRFSRFASLGLSTCALAVLACSAGGSKSSGTPAGQDDASTSDAASDTSTFEPDIGTFDALPEAPPPGKVTVDPKTCAEAAAAKTYVGCDFWPTVVGNAVWSIFDYAVVVANTSDDTVSVEVSGNGIAPRTETVAPQSLTKIFLPWNAALKGPDASATGSSSPMTASVFAAKGAYHLVASRPVTVYQFNALEYKGEGGPAGKSWASCPSADCFSYSNDASLLLPSTAMTGNYRVTSVASSTFMGAYVAITATQNGTTVKFQTKGRVVGGGAKIPATNAGGEITLTMDEGDVAQLLGETGAGADLSGSLVVADKPVQVIAGIPCVQMPEGVPACDHVEESVFPAETLGKDYFVVVPTPPNGAPPAGYGHTVRIYGNRDGTKLAYAPSKPSGAPDTLAAGQVVTFTASATFRVTGDNEFAVGTFMWGGSKVDPKGIFDLTPSKGDPSMTLMTAIEQYRTKYIFLAPDDYSVNWVDIMHPSAAKMTLDGSAVPAGAPIGATGYNVARVKLGAGIGGAHVLESDEPVGIQVLGYGDYTSYHYPGGLDLRAIAPPPEIK